MFETVSTTEFPTSSRNVYVDDAVRLLNPHGGTRGWEVRAYVERDEGLFEVHFQGRTKCGIQHDLERIQWEELFVGKTHRPSFGCASYQVVDLAC